MVSRMFTGLLGAAAIAVTLGAHGASAQEYDKRQFDVVGTWGNLNQWIVNEGPFWNERLPAASGGALTANARPQTELGVSGFEVMRLLRLGTYDFVHGLFGYVSQDSPAIEGADLAGIAQDFETYRKVLDAYRPVLERELNQRFNSKMLAVYLFPTQQLWCNLGDRSITSVSLKDMAGKRIRSYSASLSDFIEGLNATPVTIAFAEVMPALEKGVADCGITGTLPAYDAKWYQVVTHNIRIAVGYAGTFVAVNNRTWDSLNEATQGLITSEMEKLEDSLWEQTMADDELGLACTSSGPCERGTPGGMIPIEPSDEDQEMIRQILNDVVLARWAQRCGADCAQEWNETVGQVTGLTASAN